MDLQELITRGRFIFAGAPERRKVFDLVNGKMTANCIAIQTNRHVNNVQRDLRKLDNGGLIQPKCDKEGNAAKIGGFTVFEKTPLARTVPSRYFQGTSKPVGSLPAVPVKQKQMKSGTIKKPKALSLPTEKEILEICNAGEDQIYEFKGPGVETKKITREVAAMLNTRQGGMVFYGIADDGTIQGSDMKRQKFDQALQNSIKNTVSPAATVKIHSISTLGFEILVIIVPPWNRTDVYHYEDRVLLRRGTNVFAARPEENKKLHRGQYVV